MFFFSIFFRSHDLLVIYVFLFIFLLFTPKLTVTNALPATPEVNEEHSGRSASPETFQTVDATGIYNYGQSYSAYNPTKFRAKQPSKSTDFANPKCKKPKQRCCIFRLNGCFGRSRTGVYRVRNDTLPYFVRSSSVRPVGFNKISPPSLSRPKLQQKQEQSERLQIDVTKGRIRLNLYAYPRGYLKFLDSYFVCTENVGENYNEVDTSRKRLSAISEEDSCPLCGGSIDYALMTNATGRWKNALLVPF